MTFNLIINPETGEKVAISSNRGRRILKKYINRSNIFGGGDTPDTLDGVTRRVPEVSPGIDLGYGKLYGSGAPETD